jgi:hypothetical protein
MMGAAIMGIAKALLNKFDAHTWLTKDLKRGDLYSLIDVASGLRPDGLTDDQAARLLARGMVRIYGTGTFRATIKGRLALRIRQTTRSRSGMTA